MAGEGHGVAERDALFAGFGHEAAAQGVGGDAPQGFGDDSDQDLRTSRRGIELGPLGAKLRTGVYSGCGWPVEPVEEESIGAVVAFL